jgi:hypothetical protein
MPDCASGGSVDGGSVGGSAVQQGAEVLFGLNANTKRPHPVLLDEHRGRCGQNTESAGDGRLVDHIDSIDERKFPLEPIDGRCLGFAGSAGGAGEDRQNAGALTNGFAQRSRDSRERSSYGAVRLQSRHHLHGGKEQEEDGGDATEPGHDFPRRPGKVTSSPMTIP